MRSQVHPLPEEAGLGAVPPVKAADHLEEAWGADRWVDPLAVAAVAVRLPEDLGNPAGFLPLTAILSLGPASLVGITPNVCTPQVFRADGYTAPR